MVRAVVFGVSGYWCERQQPALLAVALWVKSAVAAGSPGLAGSPQL